MDFHQIRDFLAVVKTGNFTEAAHRCHVAQPSLSKALQRLEVEVGKPLFVRSKRRAILTPAGEALLPHARRIWEEFELAKKKLVQEIGRERGAIKIGVLPTISPYLLPRILPPFARDFPHLTVEVVEERTAGLVKSIEHCELDLALASLPINHASIERESLFQEELLLAAQPGHSLATREKIYVKDLETERFILMKEGHCLADQVLAFCRRHNQRVQVVFRAAQIETLLALILDGYGISLVPEMARACSRFPLVYRSLESPKPTRTVAVLWRKGRAHTPAAADFLKHLRQAIKPFLENLADRQPLVQM